MDILDQWKNESQSRIGFMKTGDPSNVTCLEPERLDERILTLISKVRELRELVEKKNEWLEVLLFEHEGFAEKNIKNCKEALAEALALSEKGSE